MSNTTSAAAQKMLLAAALLAASTCPIAQTAAAPAPAPAPAPAQAPSPAPAPATSTVTVPSLLPPGFGGSAPDAVKPYERVITSDAKTQDGLFKIHTVKDKLYFEIPKAMLDTPLLMVATATAVPVGVDHIGRELNQDVFKFSLRNNKIYLQTISHAFVSTPGNAINEAVQGSQRDTIVLTMQVEAYAKDGSPVVDFSRFFLAEIGNFSARMALRATGLDPNRSYLAGTKAFPASLRIDAVHTYGFAPAPPSPGAQVISQPTFRSGTVDVAYNIVRLPETPMKPRLMDDRVGFFGLQRFDFGTAEHGSKRERLIARWRLEKSDPTAKLSEPVKPLVWYIDKATPSWLVPYVKKGVEEWNTAFEAAGFKNAIQARPFPSKEEDPEFDPEDVRYSVIRWVPSLIPNAYGPHLADPRSGEILNSNVVLFHNIMQMLRDWYVTQAGAVDPRAQKLPLPDDLMGALVGQVVTHEIGHSLGFPHNMKASSLYPTAKLRDANWLAEMGHVPSIMDYARYNYLVQPEDKVDPALLIPKIGPYDVFAVHWGYTPIPSAKTPEEELPILNIWAREQDSKPWLRFSSMRMEGEYGELTEAVGDADAVLATTLGVKNLQRIVKNLPKMALKPDQDDRTLNELYGAVWQQWFNEMGHVRAIVGGFEGHNKHGEQPGAIFAAVPRERQSRAVKLINEQMFTTPQWLLDPAIAERLNPSQPAYLLHITQRMMLASLLSPARTARLQMQETARGASAYGVADLLQDLRSGIYAVDNGNNRLTASRRGLQRAYLDQVITRTNTNAVSLIEDGGASFRAELKTLKSLYASKAGSAGDRLSKAHWEELYDVAAKALDPRAGLASINPLMAMLSSRGYAADTAAAPEFCWSANRFFDGLPDLMENRISPAP